MKRRYTKAIREIAKQAGISAESVYAEMQNAITLGYKNLDPAVQEYWRKIAPDGKVPTPEKYIKLIITEIKKQ